MPDEAGGADGGEFAAIYAHVRRIPSGRVLSYGDVGRAVGASARTVGWAMSVAVDDDTGPVPWHRIVGADGYLRIARRGPEYAREQRARLEAEGVTFDDRARVRSEFFASADAADAPTDPAAPRDR